MGSTDGLAFYWRFPECRVVAFPSWHLVNLDREQIDSLCSTYHIHCALFPAVVEKYDKEGTPCVDYLKHMGFVEKERLGNDVILIRASTAEVEKTRT